MKDMLRGLGALTSAAILSACGITASTLDVETRGNALEDELAAQYAELTEKEVNWYDWAHADWFAERAESASAGETVQPTDPAEWDLPQEHINEAQESRRQLIAALQENRSERPAAAARAQAAYDCWVEEVDENHQPEMIEACRERFETAMAELTEVAEVEPVAAPPEVDLKSEYVFLFGFDEPTLDANTQALLQELVDKAKQADPGQVLIAGHADRAGPVPYNERLSEQRAENVAETFRQAGFDPVTQAFGESRPAVPTPDGVPEEENRRVVINFEGT